MPRRLSGEGPAVPKTNDAPVAFRGAGRVLFTFQGCLAGKGLVLVVPPSRTLHSFDWKGRIRFWHRLLRRQTKKEPMPLVRWRRPALPQGCPCSTIGASGLNFRVRYGTGCTPTARIASSRDSLKQFVRRSAQCLLPLRRGVYCTTSLAGARGNSPMHLLFIVCTQMHPLPHIVTEYTYRLHITRGC